MNEKIRQSVRVELARRNMSQTDLAEVIGTSKQHLNRVISGSSGKIPDIWLKVFNALGFELELVEKPKPKLDEESRAWLGSDLSRLGEFEPYDWGEADPETLGEKVNW